MRKRAIVPGAPSVVGKVDTEWRPFQSWVVGKVACFSGVGTVAVQEVPTDRNLVRVMLIHASESTATSACSGETRARLVDIFHALVTSTSLSGTPSVVKSHVASSRSAGPRGYL